MQSNQLSEKAEKWRLTERRNKRTTMTLPTYQTLFSNHWASTFWTHPNRDGRNCSGFSISRSAARVMPTWSTFWYYALWNGTAWPGILSSLCAMALCISSYSIPMLSSLYFFTIVDVCVGSTISYVISIPVGSLLVAIIESTISTGNALHVMDSITITSWFYLLFSGPFYSPLASISIRHLHWTNRRNFSTSAHSPWSVYAIWLRLLTSSA